MRRLLLTWGIVKDNLSTIFKNDDFIIDLNTFKVRVNYYLLNVLEKEFKKTKKQISSIIFNDEEIVLFANFLKEIGLVVFDSENEILNKTIIVNPNKFLNSVYVILNIAKKNEGIIKNIDLKEIRYYKECIETLITHNIIFKNLIDDY